MNRIIFFKRWSEKGGRWSQGLQCKEDSLVDCNSNDMLMYIVFRFNYYDVELYEVLCCQFFYIFDQNDELEFI